MTTNSHLPEEFLHYLWKHKLLSNNLSTIHGESIHIVDPGLHNMDSGPDFLCSRIRIGETLWIGNVEIHVRASDWFRHNHQRDEAYGNVIMHVVADNDRIVKNMSGRELQTLCISGAFDPTLLDRYRNIMQNMSWVPCQGMIQNLEAIHVTARIHAEAVQRLYDKASLIRKELLLLKTDWEECCYRILSAQFGVRINTSSFEMLARTLPVRVLMKHHRDLFQLESLFFGQSGLLHSGLRGKYPTSLKKEHAYLSGKYSLKPMPGYLWKFMRLRPAAFPSLRIAQLAALYHKHLSIFQEIIERKDISSLIELFELTASTYWDKHFIFGKESKASKKRFGRQSIYLLLINAIIPLLHLYGQEMNKPELCQRAISFLEELPPENNAVIKRWASLGIKANNSLESQGLLQLKRQLCDNKECLNCSIGHQLLKRH